MPSRRRHLPGGPLGSVGPGPGARPGAGSGPRPGDRIGVARPLAAGGPGGPGGPVGEIARVFVDGRNVQHALARGMGSSLPAAALVARLRAAFPPPTEVELILDGHAGGSPQGRVSPGMSVVFTKSSTADEVIGERVTEAFRMLGAVDAWAVLVVSDDREVRDHARRNGIRVESTGWLGERMRSGDPGGPRPGAATGVGHARAPRPPRG